MIPEDWEVSFLYSLCTVIDGDRGANYPNKKDFSSDGYCLFLNAGNVTKTGFVFEDCAFIDQEKDTKLRKGKLQRGDIVLTTRGTIGNFAYYNAKIPFDSVRINSGMVILRNDTEALDTDFLYASFQSHLVENQIQRITFGSAQPQLTVKGISKFIIVIPKLTEQRAIAAALADVDALIESLDKLIAKKWDIKQAAMQKLLSGKTRLPGFRDEWDFITLGSGLSQAPSYGINAPAVMFSDRLPAYIRITDITEDGRFNPETPVSVDARNAESYYLEDGDIVFARTGASVGKSYQYRTKDGKLVYAGFLIRIHPDEKLLHAPYVAEFVKTATYWRWVNLMSMRSGQPGINGTEYAQMPIPKPSINEQTAIAEVLSDMDAEIAALEKRRSKIRLLKQGMMQELLTGKTRLV